MHASGPADVFVVVCPEYAISEFCLIEPSDPYRSGHQSLPGEWIHQAIATEAKIYSTIQALYSKLSNDPDLSINLGHFSTQLRMHVPLLKHVDRINESNQISQRYFKRVYACSATFAITRLELMRKSPCIAVCALIAG